MTTTSTQVSGRRRAPVRTKEHPIDPPAPAPAGFDYEPGVEFPPDQAQGTVLRSKPNRAERAFYAPKSTGAPTSTRQAEILTTTAIAAPTSEEGIPIGEDVLSNTIVTHDVITAYARKDITSTNVLLIGDVGSTKSSVMKTCYTLRPLAMKNRRVVVFDKKDRDGRGEYAELVERYGSTPIAFTLDGSGARMNLLDPLIGKVAGTGPLSLLRTVAETIADRPLDETEVAALRRALKQVTSRFEHRRVPTVADLLPLLRQVGGDDPTMPAAGREKLQVAGLTVEFILECLLEEYSGLFDGQTSKHVRLGGASADGLAAGRLTSFDISQLPPIGPASSMVVSVANMWLMGMLRAERGWITHVNAEEGWDVIGGSAGKLWQSNIKLARGLGIVMATALHKMLDIPADSPAYAIIQEAQTRHLFHLGDSEEQKKVVSTFGLRTVEPETFGALRPGHHLLKIANSAPIHVRHVRTPLEVALTDTDSALVLDKDAD